ncbi:MAG: glycerol kinase [Kiritimatiellia bacterium]|jgi:glycerol kinase
MGETFILAIDEGTTGCTALVFDVQGHIRGKGYAEITQYFPKPGWVEHDAEEIWDVILKVIQQALDQAGLEPSDIHALGITNQRETTVIWDRSSGKPTGRAIVWQDRRTADLCENLRAAGHTEAIRAKTGLVPDPYFSGTKIQWMLNQDASLRARAEAGELAFGTMDCWLIWKLTGGRVHATDVSNASRTLLYNIHTLAWDRTLLEWMDIPEAILPEVNPSSTVFGLTDPEAFFGREVPIGGVAGDQQAALFGQACFSPGMAKNTYGTGSFILMNTGTEAVQSQHGLLTTIAWQVGDGPVVYALEGSVFISGAAVQWLRDGLQLIESAAETEALARSIESNDGVYFVPALTGLGAPHWDPYARGLIIGLTRGTTRAHLVRAALEAICYQSRDVADTMQQECSIPLQELRVDGGAVVNPFIMQHQADMLGVNIIVPQITETTALGAAYLAGLATDFWASQEEISEKWSIQKTYRPLMEKTIADTLYKQWLEAVDRSKAWVAE